METRRHSSDGFRTEHYMRRYPAASITFIFEDRHRKTTIVQLGEEGQILKSSLAQRSYSRSRTSGQTRGFATRRIAPNPRTNPPHAIHHHERSARPRISITKPHSGMIKETIMRAITLIVVSARSRRSSLVMETI